MTDTLFADLSNSSDISTPLEKDDSTDARELFIRFGESADYNEDLKRQALIILDTLLNAHRQSNKPVAITYSANAGQSKAIHQAWAENQSGAERVNGANQAQVIAAVNLLMAQDEKYQALADGNFKIMPISTMDGFDVRTSDKELRRCLEIAKNFTKQGILFVWTNQSQTASHPYAIGGGVAKVPAARHNFIMASLAKLLGDKPPEAL